MTALRTIVLSAALTAAALATAFAGEELSTAFDAYKAGDYAKAIEIASAVAADDPARLKAAYIVGESQLMLEKWDDAQTAFKEILDKKADNVPALVGLGRSQIGRSLHDEAIATLEKAVKLDAKDAPARRSLGEARYAKGEADKAIIDFAAAVKLDPKDPLAARAYVEALLKGDKLDAAEKEAERFAKAAVDSPMGHFLVGYVRDRQGKDKDAIESYEKAIAKDDKFIDAHKNLAILCVTKNPGYQNKERTKKALDHFKRYFELGGKDEKLKADYEQIKGFVEGQRGGK
jgi:tetratricopeptide (TPR) repeat protein